MKKLGVIVFMIFLLSLGVFGGAITPDNSKIDSVKKLDTNSIVEHITKIGGNTIVETVKISEVAAKETFGVNRINNNELEVRNTQNNKVDTTSNQNNKVEITNLVDNTEKNVNNKKRNSKRSSIKANLDLPLNFNIVNLNTLDDLCGYCGYVGDECKRFKDYVLKNSF